METKMDTMMDTMMECGIRIKSTPDCEWYGAPIVALDFDSNGAPNVTLPLTIYSSSEAHEYVCT